MASSHQNPKDHHSSHGKDDESHHDEKVDHVVTVGKSIFETAVMAEPILYPHLIEFALIGASFALIMAHHVGKR